MRYGVRGRGATAVQAAWTGRVRLKALGARARAERTSNIFSMVVTLDVSKLSGWLNAVANCRIERREEVVLSTREEVPAREVSTVDVGLGSSWTRG